MTEALLARAFERFDSANSTDPNRIDCSGVARPRELVDAERLTEWVWRVAPAASVALLLASRCQHLRRWEIPRQTFPEGRHGYLAWRRELAKFHAENAAGILRELGYDEPVIAEVSDINLKRNLGANPDAQAMEDALCLSFLEHELAGFARKHDADKVVSILRKTWRKMSDRGRSLAQELKPLPELQALLERALAAKTTG